MYTHGSSVIENEQTECIQQHDSKIPEDESMGGTDEARDHDRDRDHRNLFFFLCLSEEYAFYSFTDRLVLPCPHGTRFGG